MWLREEGGLALAKDTWLLGMGLGFVIDGLTRKPKVVIREVPAHDE